MSFLSKGRAPWRAPISALAMGCALFMPGAVRAQSLTLGDIFTRVGAADPSISLNLARRQAADASVRQAGIGPQDRIGVEVEDFAGTGPYSPADRAQTTAWYERTFERGDKRAARVGAARADLLVAEHRGRLRMLDLFAQVQAAWVEALAAGAAVPIAQQRLVLAERLKGEIDRRVARALDPRFAAERARTEVARARIALDQAKEAARIARTGLAAWWGGSDAALSPAHFDIEPATVAGSAELIDISLLEAEREAAAARSRLARSTDVGDPTLRGGVRHFGQGNDVALMVGGSIPLGSARANRGNVDRAEAERRASEAELAVTRAERTRELDRIVAEREALATEVRRTDAEILPSAERAVILVRDGFNRGGTAFTYLEVSQAQQAVIDARTRRAELLRRYHLLGARLDRLTGRYLPLASAETR